MSARPSHVRPSLERTLRGWFKFLGVWHVCDNAACARARACRGDIGVCGRVTFHRLPRAAQDFLLMVVDGKERGFSFDETIALINKTKLATPFCAWLESLPGAQRET
jgi:hypothetical protein